MISNLLNTVSLGPFTLPYGLLIFVAALFLYQLISRYIYRNNRVSLQQIDTVLFNSIFILFIVWKMSPLVFQLKTVIKNPLAVLYLPGGLKGLVSGALISLVYVAAYVSNKKKEKTVFVRLLLIHIAGFLGIFLLSAFVSGFLIGETNEEIESQLRIGDRAPEFVLTDSSENEYTLSESSGKVRVLNFWASWCPPCRAEMPELNSFYESIDLEMITFLSINLFTSEKSAVELESYIKEEELPFPVLYDRTGEVTGLYNITTIPTTIIIDSNGFIIHIRKGAVTESMLKNLTKN